MSVKHNPELYTKTMARLHLMQINDPTSAIIALAEEVEMYRSKIQGLIEHYEAQAAAKKSEPVKPDYVAGPATIELLPRCSKCGTKLHDVSGKIIVIKNYHGPAPAPRHQRINPASCPNCGAWFEAIEQTVVQINVEATE